ncbi:DUF4450 domain-containing protein [Mucilaginibacter paludis]|uniref:Alpha-L-rhamnosidase n=1 Tax=Mucilaginibacter paludis DSM 18603 TaxID=714943 RepID=H1YCQ3_9SPHI|nr:DUF4450 domain-containing protein [Mucilaginibacter paludis]EHQ24240.1 alpha-L-rhamnosidase [Mucilaginibacter paludis DSM 18603]
MFKNPIKRAICLSLALFFYPVTFLLAQNGPSTKLWHNRERSINYRPEGRDIVLVNGKHRFNRALYGTNTAFRVEAGDLPEFALYLPGMGGNLRFGLISGNTSKWLIDASQIEARYRAGSMLYTIHDALLGKGSLHITILAGATTESMIVKAELKGGDVPVKLFWAFGGATGKKFSRDGDLGADPESSFYLKPEYCKGNLYQVNGTSFSLKYTGKASSEADRYEIKQPGSDKPVEITSQKNQLTGLFPVGAELHIGDAAQQNSPLEFWASRPAEAPAISGTIKPVNQQALYFLIQSPQEQAVTAYTQLPGLFNAAEAARQKLADRVQVNTPDPYINTLGGVLSVAADAIWETPSYMHGAVAWRMRLNAWRGPYVADVLGWHDRARSHFSSYALSQITSPETGPVVADTALHLARQQERLGNAMFSSGYISRNPGGKIQPHHYDMNLVFIDELLNHFNWTGDLDYVKQMWPVIKRHLAWEKRNFDADGDGLYDAYCAIWASDALQYSGGGVTHSSAYNYRANKAAAQLAKLIGEDAAPYQKEAEHILNAINKTLWMPQTGQYAEYQDLLGNKLLHPAAALWTVYHAIDSQVPDNFQAYQALRYVDNNIPHIPIRVKGIPDGFYTMSTTNWMPYDWSLNNVVLAEVLHTSLAYWQGGRAEEAFKLWKGSLLNSMFLESSPGNFDQLSFYDSTRGELYRDFGDPIGMAGRSLIEGLFGIHPDALNGKLLIKPGFPMEWDHASLHTPDIQFDFKESKIKPRNSKKDDYIFTDSYTIIQSFPTRMNLVIEIKAKTLRVKSIIVNGRQVNWENIDDAITLPMLRISLGKYARYNIQVNWATDESQPSLEMNPIIRNVDGPISVGYKDLRIDKMISGKDNRLIYDPQKAFKMLNGDTAVIYADHTVFYPIAYGKFKWWVAADIEIAPDVQIIANDQLNNNSLTFKLKINLDDFKGKVVVNPGINQFVSDIVIGKKNISESITVPINNLITGSNVIRIEYNNKFLQQTITNWNIKKESAAQQETINLTPYFNDQVTNIFKNKYLSPRPKSVTLQLPWQGIGNWCYPLVEANIDDSGLRRAVGDKNEFDTPQHIRFATPGKAGEKNILFTSQWDNYPKQAEVPLTGRASHAYFLMAGSTNPMQSRITNGEVIIEYTDHTTEVLELKNPQTWWPIEQDYEDDGYAFQLNAARPIRVYLKSGLAATAFNDFKSIKGFSNRGIDGGAGTILDLPLNPAKELKALQLKTLANDVMIGLMAVTLVRN